MSSDADNVASAIRSDQEYLTLPIGTWGVEVVVAGNYSLAGAVLGLVAVRRAADDIELYKPATVQAEPLTALLTSSNKQRGVVTFREDLVESDGTTQLYLVMAGLASTVATILLKGYLRLTDRR